MKNIKKTLIKKDSGQGVKPLDNTLQHASYGNTAVRNRFSKRITENNPQ